MTADAKGPERIWTIGHSTRSNDEFMAALDANAVKLIADVRLLPGSKRYPHFNAERLADSLGAHGIRYDYFPELGGRRKPRPDSPNKRLREAAVAAGPTAILCAEAVWWRCHRGLISDYLKVRGIEVVHIIDQKKTEPHPWTSAAQVEDGELSYRVAC